MARVVPLQPAAAGAAPAAAVAAALAEHRPERWSSYRCVGSAPGLSKTSLDPLASGLAAVLLGTSCWHRSWRRRCCERWRYVPWRARFSRGSSVRFDAPPFRQRSEERRGRGRRRGGPPERQRGKQRGETWQSQRDSSEDRSWGAEEEFLGPFIGPQKGGRSWKGTRSSRDPQERRPWNSPRREEKQGFFPADRRGRPEPVDRRRRPEPVATAGTASVRPDGRGGQEAQADSQRRFFAEQARIPVEISPKDPSIEPLESFSDAPLHSQLSHALRNKGFEFPTPSQQWAIPYLLAKKDVMVCSQTGSGKTLAYLIPLLEEVLQGRRGQGRAAAPIAVVLSPTRELAVQIAGEAEWLLGAGEGQRAACIYGGVPYRESLSSLREGGDLVVATPGRLEDACSRGDVTLRDVQAVVLDEADRMLDLGFEPQIRELLTRRGMPKVGVRRTAMFSATFGEAVQHLAVDFLDAYTFIAVGRVGSASQTVTQRLIWAEDAEKPGALLGVLLRLNDEALQRRENTGVMIFVNTKDAARSVERSVKHWNFWVSSIHGDKQQAARNSALVGFRRHIESRLQVDRPLAALVCTDVAARGLDIPDVGCVVQYELPTRIDDFVHRAGRTGRLGRRGLAIGFADARTRGISADLITLLAGAGETPPLWLQGMAVTTGADPEELSRVAGHGAYGAQDTRLSGAGVQTAEERAEAQKLRTFEQDAYGS